jgi:hypothetical protein
MASPPSSSWNGTSALSVFETELCDNENKLNVYGILVCTGEALPADIHNFVTTLQAGTRSSLDTAHSPNTLKVAQQQHIALRQDKQDGIDMLRDFLLSPDHAHESMLAIRVQHHLHKDFLPSDAALAESWGPLRRLEQTIYMAIDTLTTAKVQPPFQGTRSASCTSTQSHLDSISPS